MVSQARPLDRLVLSAEKPARRRLWRLGGTAIAAMLLVAALSLAVLSDRASAQLFEYCNTPIQSGNWCGNNGVNHTYHAQEILVPSGSNQTCERMIRNSTGGVRAPGPTCGGSTFHAYCYTGAGSTGIQYQAEARQISSGTRQLEGNAYYGTLSPNIC